MGTPPIVTERLELRPLTAVVEAFIAADADRLAALAGAAFPRPLRPPPLFADDLPGLLAYVRAAPERARPRLLVRRDTGEAVGAAGVAAPDADGPVEIGYAVYPEQEGRGYATEAARGLVRWALAQPGVRRVVAAGGGGGGVAAGSHRPRRRGGGRAGVRGASGTPGHDRFAPMKLPTKRLKQDRGHRTDRRVGHARPFLLVRPLRPRHDAETLVVQRPGGAA